MNMTAQGVHHVNVALFDHTPVGTWMLGDTKPLEEFEFLGYQVGVSRRFDVQELVATEGTVYPFEAVAIDPVT